MTAASSILLVEDSPEDVEATRRALKRSGVISPLFLCTDGDDALDFLHRRGRHAQPPPPRPGLILLDLNLPGTDGRAVLEEIKGHSVLRQIPVVVLTTSGDERDVSACYLAGANSYMQKPVDFAAFSHAIGRLMDYWFEVVLLPREA